MSRLLSIIVVAGSLACRPAAPEGLDRAMFIDIVVELRKAAREYPDSSTFDVRKAAVLRDAGVSDSALAVFIRAHNADTRYMAEVWEAIDKRVNPPAGEPTDTVR